MSFNGHKDPFPKWFPMFLVGVSVAGVLTYQLFA